MNYSRRQSIINRLYIFRDFFLLLIIITWTDSNYLLLSTAIDFCQSIAIDKDIFLWVWVLSIDFRYRFFVRANWFLINVIMTFLSISTLHWWEARFDYKSRYTFSGPGWRKGDNAIDRISHYTAASVVCFVNSYALESDLSGGYSYPPFEQQGPGPQPGEGGVLPYMILRSVRPQRVGFFSRFRHN